MNPLDRCFWPEYPVRISAKSDSTLLLAAGYDLSTMRIVTDKGITIRGST